MKPAINPGKKHHVEEMGRKLRQLRKARSFTQANLAARVGIQQSDLCRMETGQYRISLDTLVKILAALEVSASEFFQEEPAADLTPGETALLHSYRRLSSNRQEEIRRFIRFICNDTEPSDSARSRFERRRLEI